VARKGDLIVVTARRVGGPPREGEIIEVIERDLRVQYRVRWNDGHESLFAPGTGTATIEPPRHGDEVRSERTKSRKPRARASTAKRSTTRKSAVKTRPRKTTRSLKSKAKKSTTKSPKSTGKKSVVRKVASKRTASRGPKAGR
jgi:hypothetical protein